MFFSEFILTKKGSLAKVWLAAHWDRKLTKAQICSADIQTSVGKLTISLTRLEGQGKEAGGWAALSNDWHLYYFNRYVDWMIAWTVDLTSHASLDLLDLDWTWTAA